MACSFIVVWSCCVLDIHSHIVFDVDDGSKNLDMSTRMLRAAKNVGIDKIVATPHCRWDSFDRGKIERNFDIVADRAGEMGIDMFLGYEVNWRKIPELGLDEICTMNIESTKLFLLEFSDDALPANWQRLVRVIQSRGLRVVIAHPERYAPVQRDLDVAWTMKEMGCLIQVSANFIEDRRLGARRRTATSMLKEGIVDYVASDAHCPKDYDYYEQALTYARNY